VREVILFKSFDIAFVMRSFGMIMIDLLYIKYSKFLLNSAVCLIWSSLKTNGGIEGLVVNK